MALTFSLLDVVTRALKDALIPFESVSCRIQDDRSTWRVRYLDAATVDQRTQGDAIVATLPGDDPTTLANLKADAAVSLADMDVAKALATALWECIPSPLMTKLQLRNRILALLKA